MKFKLPINQEGRPSLLVNALSNWGAFGVSIMIGLFLSPYIIGHLGKSGYGIWMLISSIIGYYGILDLGVTSAITRYVARYAGQKDYGALNETVSTALAIFTAVALVVLGGSFLVGAFLPGFFRVPADQVANFRHVVWILGAGTALGFPGYLLGAVTRAHERFVAANLVNVAVTLLRSGLIILFLSRGGGLIGLSFAHLASAVVLLGLNILVCRKILPHFRPNKDSIRWRTVRTLFIFGAASTVSMVADQMRFNLDSFVLGKWVSLPAVAVFGIAAQLMNYFLQFISNGTQAVYMPRYAAMDGERKDAQLKKLFLNSLSISAFLSFGLGTMMILFGKDFIRLWVGEGFTEAAPVLMILTICYSIALAQNPGIALVYALKKHYLFAGASLLEGICNLALSIYLAPRYGIIGVALGTAVPMLIIKLFIQPIYVSRLIQVSILQYWKKILPPAVVAAALLLLGEVFSTRHVLKSGYISLAFNVAPFIAVFAISFYIFNKYVERKSSHNVEVL